MVRRNGSVKRRERAPRPTRPREEIPVDVQERAEEYVVTADLPGIRKQDIDVRVKKNRVQILVDVDESEAAGPFARRVGERGSIARVVRLPGWVNERRVNAEYLNGTLRLTLPKRHRRTSVEVE